MSDSKTPSPSKSPPPQLDAPTTCYLNRSDAEITSFIHQRYEDIALVIFRQEQKRRRQPANYLVFGESTQHRAYSSHGNASVIIKKSGKDLTKTDERPIQSQFCTIL
jgi:hypothetical protein